MIIISTVRSTEYSPNHPPLRTYPARHGVAWGRGRGRCPNFASAASVNAPNDTDCGGDDERSDIDSGGGAAHFSSNDTTNGNQRGSPRLTEVRAHKPWSPLGFLVDPRRFNVTITRARALLICVGDPMLLIQVVLISVHNSFVLEQL